MTSKPLSLAVTLAVVLLGAARVDADLIGVENGTPDVIRFSASGTQSTFVTANLDSPIGIGVGPDGRVYVVDQGVTSSSTYHDSVSVCSPSGTPQGFFVSPSTAPGNTLNAPYDIAFDGSGNAYVTNGASYVAVYNAAGAYRGYFGTTGTNVPTGIGYNPVSHELYISNSGNNSFAIYNPADLSKPVAVVTPTGAGALDSPQQLAFDDSGNVYIASYGVSTNVAMVQKYSSSGMFLNTVASVADGGAEGVAIDPTTGDVFVSLLIPGAIERFSPTGTDLGAFASNLNGITYLGYEAVPEPGCLVLSGVVLSGTIGYRVYRRWRQSGRAA